MCGLTYTKQGRIIAWIEIIISTISILSIAITTLVILASPSLREYIDHLDPYNLFNVLTHFPASEKVPIILVPLMYFAGELFLAYWLLKSIEQKNYKRLRIWYVITITVCMTGLYFFIPGIIFTDDSSYFLVGFIISYLFTVYSVYVVSGLMRELKDGGLHIPISHQQYGGDDDDDKF